MLRIIIIEDEEKTLQNILSIIENYCEDVEVLATASSVEQATKLLQKTSPDLVLSDINLPDGTCFKILEQLESIDFKIIFITAFEEYAIKAIKFSALDYLVKPLNPKELISTIKKAQKHIDNENENIKLKALLSNVQDLSNSLKRVVLKTSESIYIVNVQDIIRCESDSSYTMFFLQDGRKIIVSKVLKEYDELLKDSGFIRVHKSHLINMNFITSYEKSNGGYILMKDKAEVPVSVRKKDFVMKIFESF